MHSFVGVNYWFSDSNVHRTLPEGLLKFRSPEPSTDLQNQNLQGWHLEISM